jgi:hypothetical protein
MGAEKVQKSRLSNFRFATNIDAPLLSHVGVGVGSALKTQDAGIQIQGKVFWCHSQPSVFSHLSIIDAEITEFIRLDCYNG